MYLSEKDVYYTIFAFPQLHHLKLTWLNLKSHLRKIEEPHEKFIPEALHESGTQRDMFFSDATFFNENRDGCLRYFIHYFLFIIII